MLSQLFTARFLWPVGDRINGVPLYVKGRDPRETRESIESSFDLLYFGNNLRAGLNNIPSLCCLQLRDLYVIKHRIHSVKSFHHKCIDLDINKKKACNKKLCRIDNKLITQQNRNIKWRQENVTGKSLDTNLVPVPYGYSCRARYCHLLFPLCYKISPIKQSHALVENTRSFH